MDNRHCFSICRKRFSGYSDTQNGAYAGIRRGMLFKKEPNREDAIEILQAVIRHHRKIAMLGLVGLLAASIWLQ